jgi:hypothetical protein
MICYPCASVRLDGNSVFISGDEEDGKKLLGIEIDLNK